MTSRDWDVEVFFDGACPLCAREIAFLRARDRSGRIRFTDIAAAGFEPTLPGVEVDAWMARIHGRLPDGSILEGVEVFRRLYTAIGLGPVVALTRLPGIRTILDRAYSAFAANRLRLTGRCEGSTCAIPTDTRPLPHPHGAEA